LLLQPNVIPTNPPNHHPIYPQIALVLNYTYCMRTMSSDYGSDIDSDVADVVDEIVSSQQAPPSSAQIPRRALKPLNTNTSLTPPSSHDKPNEITLQQWHQAASTPPPSASSSDAEP